MVILNVIGLILLLLLLPYAIGLGILHVVPERGLRASQGLILGYIGLFAILELAGIPLVLTFVYNGYTIFCLAFGLLAFVAAVPGAYLWIRDLKSRKDGESLRSRIRKILSSFGALPAAGKLFLLLLFGLLAYQLVMVFLLASYDADDFYYNAQALSAQRFGTMYRIDESTGRSIPLDIRHGLALFPMWEAFVSTLSGLHVVIVAHRAVPLVLIPLSCLLVYEISGFLFPEKPTERIAFTLLMNVWRLFGHVSYFTSETFLFTRTWQGKSFAGNFILPAIVWVFLCLFSHEEQDGETGKGASLPGGWWWILAMLILASGASSSLAVLLSIMLTGILALLFALLRKKILILLKALACCIPGIIYILIYVVN